MQAERLAEQELMQPNRIAAILQPRYMQHQHPVEGRADSTSASGAQEPQSNAHGTDEASTGMP